MYFKLFQVFSANTDVSTVVRHNLTRAILTRYIRVHPGYYTGQSACMRLELYGCEPTEEKGLLKVVFYFCLLI